MNSFHVSEDDSVIDSYLVHPKFSNNPHNTQVETAGFVVSYVQSALERITQVSRRESINIGYKPNQSFLDVRNDVN